MMALRQLISLREIPISLSQNFLHRKLNLNTLFKQNALLRGSRNVRSNRSDGFAPKRSLVIEGVPIKVDPGHIHPQKLWRSFLFTVAFSAGSFATVTIWEYETIRSKALNALRHSLSSTWLKQRLQTTKQEVSQLRRDFDAWWSKLSPGEKIFVPICAANIIVYGLWRIPRIQPTMLKYFASNPAARAVCWPMVLSTFSHYSLFHIFANMYVLHSFSHAAVATMGREHFLGFYLSAGVIASFASHVFKTVVKQPGLSLGASGAIMGVLGYVCTQYPETQLSILFLPMFQFSAGSAIQVIMGMDLLGVLFGWRVFDHAAHLGGALFGVFWAYYGAEHLWPKREFLVGCWHELRGPPRK